jgi:hypothetical protein
MKIKTFDFIAYIVFIIVIGVLVYFIFFIDIEAKQCLKNPFIYGAVKMEDVSCTCFQEKLNPSCPAMFSFNETTFHILKTECGGIVQEINLNRLNITK